MVELKEANINAIKKQVINEIPNIIFKGNYLKYIPNKN